MSIISWRFDIQKAFQMGQEGQYLEKLTPILSNFGISSFHSDQERTNEQAAIIEDITNIYIPCLVSDERPLPSRKIAESYLKEVYAFIKQCEIYIG